MWSSHWNENWRGNSEKIRISVSFSRNPTWPDLGSNLGRRVGEPMTDWPTSGTAYLKRDVHVQVLHYIPKKKKKKSVVTWQEKHSGSVTRTSGLLLLTEMTAIYFAKQTKRLHTLRGKNAEHFNVKASGMCKYTVWGGGGLIRVLLRLPGRSETNHTHLRVSQVIWQLQTIHQLITWPRN
jgi:hypothetical protein